jgi:effector-binding domain-containing protein
MLMLKRAEVEERLGEEQERLMRINARLRQLEREETMPNYEVVLKSVPAMLVASRRVTIPTNDQVPEYLMPAFSEASAHAQQQGAKETGPCLAVWHTPSDVYTNEVAEVAIPVDRKVPSSDRVQVYELPAAQVASVVHQGDFDEFTQGHTAALLWIEANGYRVDGPYREVYIKTEPADSITEIQYPVAKA